MKAVDFLGMQQHYWKPKLLTIFWHTQSNKNLYWKQSSDSSQKLVSALNCGGLWIITQPAQQIFFRKAECNFRQFTSETDLQRLDISGITHNAMSDSDICNLMISDAELEPDSHVRKDVLHGIVSVYINVLSFSFVKDIIQRYKIAAKQTKARVLCKEISRNCKGEEQQRQVWDC